MEDRIEIQTKDCKYLVDRYCPHQMADMQEEWLLDDNYLVCPRHGWKFDLKNNGKCTDNNETINAVSIKDM